MQEQQNFESIKRAHTIVSGGDLSALRFVPSLLFNLQQDKSQEENDASPSIEELDGQTLANELYIKVQSDITLQSEDMQKSVNQTILSIIDDPQSGLTEEQTQAAQELD